MNFFVTLCCCCCCCSLNNSCCWYSYDWCLLLFCRSSITNLAWQAASDRTAAIGSRQPAAVGDHCRPVVSRRRLERIFAISHETVQFAVTKDSRIRSAVFISLSVCAQPSTAIAHKVRARDFHSHRSNNAPTTVTASVCLRWSVLRNEIGMRHFYEEILTICESFTSFSSFSLFFSFFRFVSINCLVLPVYWPVFFRLVRWLNIEVDMYEYMVTSTFFLLVYGSIK